MPCGTFHLRKKLSQPDFSFKKETAENVPHLNQKINQKTNDGPESEENKARSQLNSNTHTHRSRPRCIGTPALTRGLATTHPPHHATGRTSRTAYPHPPAAPGPGMRRANVNRQRRRTTVLGACHVYVSLTHTTPIRRLAAYSNDHKRPPTPCRARGIATGCACPHEPYCRLQELLPASHDIFR